MPDLSDALQVIRQANERELATLSATLEVRRKYIRQMKAINNLSSMYVGDSVRLTDIRPKYLAGASGEITEMTGEYITVKLTPPIRSRYSVVVPAQCVEKIH